MIGTVRRQEHKERQKGNRTALTKTSEQIPIANGRLVLGIWQGIYLWEHRQHGQSRELVIHLIGN